MNSRSIAYRPEIDGLRAISVLGVIAFHANLGVTGGFVGVDVFFVISGFLISKIVRAEIEAGSFSLVGFWERRIRRIFPAVLFMNLSVLAISLILIFPADYYNLLIASRYLVFGVPNYYYWTTIDYFSDHSAILPLLHTWSLGVEEQFYVFFPLAMAVIARRWPHRLLLFLISVAAASFALSVRQVETGQSATAFFLLPGRAWELLVGCILTIRNPFENLGRGSREAISMSSLGGIVLAMLSYEEGMSFPGAFAALPVIAASAFIAANGRNLTGSGRMLALPGFARLGKLSFSWYLWHWPLMAFANLFFPDVVWLPLVCAVASLPIAWFSWRHVEEPFRRKQVCVTRRAIFRFFVAANAGLLVWAQAGRVTNGFHQRTWAMSERAQEIYRVGLHDFTFDPISEDTQDDFLAGKTRTLGTCDDGRPSFFLWGDSHAMVLSRTFDSVARQLGICGSYAYDRGVNIVTCSRSGDRPASNSGRNSFEKNVRILERVEARGIRNIVLVNRWSMHLDGPEGADELAGFIRFIRERCPESSVYVFQEVPPHRYRRRSFHYRFFLSETIGWPFVFRPTDRTDYSKIARPFETAMANSDDPHVIRIDVADRFFDAEGKLVRGEGQRSYYSDEDHVSVFGSERILRPVIEEVLRRISGTNSRPRRVGPQDDARFARKAAAGPSQPGSASAMPARLSSN